MRLTETQQATIRELARGRFGDDADVIVFGSRVNSEGRGGDLDLYIETGLTGEEALDAELAFSRDLQDQLGEQRIDITVHSRGKPLSNFDKYARESGVHL